MAGHAAEHHFPVTDCLQGIWSGLPHNHHNKGTNTRLIIQEIDLRSSEYRSQSCTHQVLFLSDMTIYSDI
jgi:hypothetical protein